MHGGNSFRHNIPMTLILTRKIGGWQIVVMLAGNYDRCIEKPFRGNSIERAGSSHILCQVTPKNFIL